eukprot:g5936.t1
MQSTLTRSGALFARSRHSWAVRSQTHRSAQNNRPKTPFEFLSERGPEIQQLLQDASKVILSSGFNGVRRSTQAAIATTSVLSDYLASVRQGKELPPPVILRTLFERLGATYIKLGQFIASSPTLFPDDYVLEFQKCLDATESVSFEVIRKRINEELGFPMESAFSRVDSTPLASASIAQVHAATLKSSNKEVVIKVLKPGVESVLKTDLDFLYLASRVLELINPDISRLSLSGIVSDIRRTIEEEVNFKKEVQHIQHFQNYLQSTGLTSIAKAPFVYTQYSSKKILTMERLNGAPLIDLDAIRRVTTLDPERVLIAALNTWFGSLLGAETFHADVHAGNLLVLPDGKVGFIDFGIVGKISSATWAAMEAFLKSTATEDFAIMARALATMGATSEKVDLIALETDLRELFKAVNSIDSEFVISASSQDARIRAEMLVNDDQVNDLLLKIVRTGETHGLKFPREFGLLLKQILYFDRYVKILAPTLQIVNDRRINLGGPDF